MAPLDIRQRTGYLFLALTVGHIVLISAQVNTQRGIPILEAVTFGLFAEVQRGATAMIAGTRDVWQNYFALQQVRGENEQLQQEVARLRIALQEEQALAQQSRTLQELLDMRVATELKTAAARVIAGGASPDFRTMTIDKGTRAGLQADMAVLAPSGVVGRVITPSALAAKVQLLIDRNAAVGALVARSRAQGIVVGTGGPRLRMDYVAGTADVETGDTIVTSGIDGIYPKGFVIGQIESLTRGAGDIRDIVIRPAVDFSTLEAVLVVLTPPPAIELTESAGAAQDPE